MNNKILAVSTTFLSRYLIIDIVIVEIFLSEIDIGLSYVAFLILAE